MHMHLLPNGKVLYHDVYDETNIRLWNPATGVIEVVPPPPPPVDPAKSPCVIQLHQPDAPAKGSLASFAGASGLCSRITHGHIASSVAVTRSWRTAAYSWPAVAGMNSTR